MAISSSRADVEVAPLPREVRPDGTRDPIPAVPKAQDPRETVERIIKNSKAVGDKLAMTDLGTDTRMTQKTILNDIQSLIDRQENPPPQSGQDKKDSKDNQPNEKDKKNDMMPMNGMNDMPPPPKSGMDNQPMGGSDQPKGRKPRQQGNDEPKEKGMDPHKNANDNKTQAKEPAGTPQNPKKESVGAAGQQPKGSQTTLPSIPPEEAVVKDVWGYLPDKLRQQTMQYYKQEFMPRYAKLLEHYYSSLSDKNMKK
jgi:hypothetical protein